MKKPNELDANGQAVRMVKVDGEDYICLTDIARFKNPEFPADVVRNWMRSKMTVAFLGLWEQLHNPDFKLVEFDQFKNEAGTNAFVLPPQVWIEKTNAIGIISKSGRYGGGMQSLGRDFAALLPESKVLTPRAFSGSSIKSSVKALEEFASDRMAAK